ncbi:4-hydroxy-2-oxoglutarate aldolase, mitochondrial [Notothenia coriiceps]|uniref:4-hydroxy-2-oxoglutarate aldolase, mitochondrial n=1 Tax=Notothenia coriiceps TaxID=8208 RepID=A0A6I9NKT9_9TELE|nr:PREDICTED: 4-hydroxy-2-oxoglutarate aldolase, mitochondrial [Notothenia coriiceps]
MQCVRVLRELRPLCRAQLSAWTGTRTGTRTQSQAAGTRLDLSGIYPPIATPFTAEEEVDYPRLEGNLQKYAQIPFRGQTRDMSPLPNTLSNGWFCPFASLLCLKSFQIACSQDMLTNQSKKKLYKYQRAKITEKTTRATVQLTEKMAAAGADVVLVVTPCFYKGKMDSRALIQHFTKISRIGLIVHKTKSQDFQVLAGSAGFLMAAYCVGKKLNED